MGKFIDLTGQRFGRLTALGIEGKDKYGKTIWRCQCDCGNQHATKLENLRNGYTKSCGCLNLERTSNMNKKHGESKTRLHNIWLAMRDRCNNPNNKSWKHYGGRGIKVCKEWNCYETFMDWALSNGYDENAEFHKCTIERIDVNGNYEPSNCCWLSMKEQANNTRRNYSITYKGVTHTISQWAEITGFPRSTINERLKNGWTVEKALTKKPRKYKHKEVT